MQILTEIACSRPQSDPTPVESDAQKLLTADDAFAHLRSRANRQEFTQVDYDAQISRIHVERAQILNRYPPSNPNHETFFNHYRFLTASHLEQQAQEFARYELALEAAGRRRDLNPDDFEAMSVTVNLIPVLAHRQGMYPREDPPNAAFYRRVAEIKAEVAHRQQWTRCVRVIPFLMLIGVIALSV